MDIGRPFAGRRALRSHLGTSYHAVLVDGHPWIRAICGGGAGAAQLRLGGVGY
jgi:hypothetical protein